MASDYGTFKCDILNRFSSVFYEATLVIRCEMSLPIDVILYVSVVTIRNGLQPSFKKVWKP